MQPEERQFEEPWQAEALALAMALVDGGRFSSVEWANGLGAAIKRATEAGDRGDGPMYYHHVLDALEQMLIQKSLTTGAALSVVKEEWRVAYAATPHGQPVLIDSQAHVRLSQSAR
jgi:nitrile hydratase accessory protein